MISHNNCILGFNIVKNLFGLDIPGTGFGVGFDRTLAAAEQFGLIPQIKTSVQVLMTVLEEKYLGQSLEGALKLRKSKISIEVYPRLKEKLDKQLKYANKKGIPWVIIIGPDEIKQNKVTLKNMQTGTQETLSLEKTIQKLKK